MSREAGTISCDEFADRLMDFLEDDVDGAARRAMEVHAHHCTACAALLADLRRVSAEAARLPVRQPSRDLWSGIESRIRTPVTELAPRRRSRVARLPFASAIAAGLILAAGLGYAFAKHTATPPGATAVPAPATLALGSDTAPQTGARGQGAGVGTTTAVLAARRRAAATPAAVEHAYDSEIAGLRAVLDARRSHLDPTTVAVVEHNLAVIDSAVAQCEAALAKDPASRYLMQSLTQSLDSKVQLLRVAASLPSTT